MKKIVNKFIFLGFLGVVARNYFPEGDQRESTKSLEFQFGLGLTDAVFVALFIGEEVARKEKDIVKMELSAGKDPGM